MDFKTVFKKYYVYLLAVAVFAVAAIIYCNPAMSGKVLAAHDYNTWVGASHELTEHASENGEGSWWTNSMFCGMPAYQIGGGAEYKATRYKAPLNNILHKCIYNPVWAVFFYFVCFFILLLAFGLSPWTSLLGALITGLSSYFIVVITAGHNTKIAAIALTAVVLAGYKLIFDRKYIIGALLVMVFVASGYTLHPQMFYYYCLMMGLLWFAELWKHIKEHKLKTLAVSTAVFLLAFGVGIGTGMSNFFTNIEYMKESTRGGSDLAPYLTEAASEGQEAGTSSGNGKGLDYEYATQWSYGIDETLTLMIPGFKGSSSTYRLPDNSRLVKEMRRHHCTQESIAQTQKSLPLYWGPQPMTQGSVYVGAIVCFLFVLGLFIVKGPYKWMLLLCTVFSILLSWGSNLPWLTKFFFNYFPLYNKFRAVSSVLIVAEITMPVLALMALERVVSGKVEKKDLVRPLLISAALTAGICLFFLVFGGIIYDFKSVNDANSIRVNTAWFMDAVYAQRKALFNSDCLRSLLLILVSAGILWCYAKDKVKAVPAAVAVCLLCVGDLWSIDRRFLSDADFVRPTRASSTFKMEPYEEMILKDPSLNFRVMNLTVPTFSDSRTSYYLKSVGGYSAAKLSRYADLIEHDLKPMHMPVLNMLNTKYFLFKHEGSDSVFVSFNRDAMGNAWWVRDIKVADNPMEEIESLMDVDLRRTAVVGKDYSEMAPATIVPTTGSSVRLLKAEPNYLEYVTDSRQDGVVVFSEIFYPHGWQARIDGKPAQHYRADYVLRAMNVPAGKHGITFTFDPPAVKKGDAIALVFIIIMYASIVAAAGYGIFTLLRSSKRKGSQA
ncbi:MAG: YfhO family protein [Candidatus Cryptobacteroides sp.]